MASRGSALLSWFLLHPWLTVVLTLALIGTAASGARLLTFSSDYRMFFSDSNPQLQAFEAMQNTYTKTDNVLFVIAPRDGQIFTRSTLASLQWLTDAAWKMPYSLRVDSVTNYQHTEAEGDDLLVADLVEDAEAMSDEELIRVRDIAVNEPLLRHRLISPDADVTGVNVTIQLPGKRLDEVPEVEAYARDLAAQLEARNPDLDVYLTGLVIMNAAFPKMARGDMQGLYPLMFLVILVTLGVLLRSIPGTIATALVLVLSIAATMGITGWIGVKMSPPTTSVPVMVMTLAVADCVHILVSFLHALRGGLDKRAAMAESLRINLSPVFLTSITTVVGFLSLNFSEAPPFRDLGNMTAIGVSIAFLLSVSFLPALMMLLPVRHLRSETTGHRAMDALGAWVIRRRKLLLWLMGGMALLLIVQIPRNQLNDEFVKYFDEGVSFRADTEFATEHLTGIYLLEYSLPAQGEGGISDPEYLRHLEGFANWYRQQPRVLHVNVLTDVMKRLNRNMHGDDPAWYRLPDQRDLSAQYLLLYEFSLPFGLDLNNQINVKKSATRMTVTMESVSSEELLEINRQAEAWLRGNTPAWFHTEGASPALMFAHIGHRNIRAMLEGTTLALLVISGILVIALRSLRIGVISLLPNLAPIAMAFGLWGMLVGQVGLALSVVSGMTMGVVVDDTIHFLSKYLRARRERGLDEAGAVRYAFHTVGTALSVTTLVLMLGFGVLTMSEFQLNAGMGLLTAITLGLALLADFLLLPPLLIALSERTDAKNPVAPAG